MFSNKFIIVFLLFFFTLSILGMDFSDDGGGMNFGGDEVETTQKVKKSKKKISKKSNKKNKKNKKKKKKKKLVKEEDSGMSFGDDDSGMSFGEDESGGMTFGDDETASDGKIKEEEMNFDIAEVDKELDSKGKSKKDKVKIITKSKSYVEKGVYFKLSSGTTYLVSPKLSKGAETDERSLLGFNSHLSLGYDINTALSLEVYGEFIFNQAQIKGENNILYSRDFNSRTLGLGLNFNVLNSERTNIHLNLHGGLLMIDPSLEIEGTTFSAGGLIGFEYYLLLRHFSTSVFVSSDYMTGYDTLSISLSASLKYSF